MRHADTEHADTEVVLPKSRLSRDPASRTQELLDYFADRRVHCRPQSRGHWRLRILPPPTAEYYVDPHIEDGLRWWDPTHLIHDIPFSYRRQDRIFSALSDAWTLLSWSQWLAKLGSLPDRLTILHIDDHDDLMSPRLAIQADGFTDLLTGAHVSMTSPDSVRAAISSGAIGMGSFIAPFLHTIPSVDIRHLCDTKYSRIRTKIHAVNLTITPDTLLMPGESRPSIALSEGGRTAGTYRAGNNLTDLLADITEAPILVHLDLDFFNNRFDWDSDWTERTDRHDPSLEQILGRADDLLTALKPVHNRIADTSIGISPGFFPAEYWQPVYDTLIRALALNTCPVDTWRA